jgi:cytochrome c oxidase assembly factor CtaG
MNPIWDLFFALIVLGVGSWYWAEHPARLAISRSRQFLFYFGLALLAILTVGPVSHLAVRKFAVHMVQHVGIMMLISPLLILGSPGTLLLNSKFSFSRKLANFLRKNFLMRNILRPEAGFLVFLTALILTHFSPLANKAMVDPNFHVLELLIFITAGLIYYYPVMSGNPTPFFVPYSTRVLSLFAMMVPETMTGFFLYSGNRLLHNVPKNISHAMAMTDQHTGGAIMWAMGMLIDSIWIVLAARDWFANENLKGSIDE